MLKFLFFIAPFLLISPYTYGGTEGLVYAKKPDGSDDKTIIVGYVGNEKSVTIPNSVTEIRDRAFLMIMSK
ncbi:hypothetical protein C0W35_21360 [Photobacterium kishitanii]|uniref:hypothetical protein n=1 Tax=Photobacterium kishitanii TaxID=318456 RepID=UPI000D177193|nr:hypothetical protein [Photobacterium kishitanii]PSU87551.1 hypothetical protein C0W35_21360 [Photobacterium kishitanii]